MKKSSYRHGIVAALSLVAVFLVYKNVVQAVMDEPVQGVNESALEPDNTLSRVSLMSSKNNNLPEQSFGAARTASLHYIFENQRDPFTFPNKEISPLQTKAKAPAVTTIKSTTKNRPKLTAVLLGPVHNYALIDGEIVTEGESINGVRVLRIAKATVVLKGSDGEFSLTLTTARLGKSYE